MTTSVVSFRMDDDLKKTFNNLCKDIGMSIATAFTVFAKSSVKNNKLMLNLEGSPKISDDPFWQIPENVDALRRSVKELEEGKCAVHELIEVED